MGSQLLIGLNTQNKPQIIIAQEASEGIWHRMIQVPYCQNLTPQNRKIELEHEIHQITLFSSLV